VPAIEIRTAVEEVQAFTKARSIGRGFCIFGAIPGGPSSYQRKRANGLEGRLACSCLSIADSGERKSTCDG
jgi:hypothetical protein